MRVALVWYWEKGSEIWPNWHDGYRAAWKLIAEFGHDVVWFLDKKVPNPQEHWDFICLWSDSNCEFFKLLGNYPNIKKGICLSSDNNLNLPNLWKLDIVFVESKPVFDLVRQHGLKTILAFGTDTDFFTPDESVEKDIDYFYPATFSPWKKQSEIAHLGKKLLCVGTVQPDGQAELDACLKRKVKVKVGYFPAEEIRDYYRRAKKVIIPAIHGSERTVLEAMSMNVPVEITNTRNRKAQSYIDEFEASRFESTRAFVVKRYSHEVFAENLLKGITQ